MQTLVAVGSNRRSRSAGMTSGSARGTRLASQSPRRLGYLNRTGPGGGSADERRLRMSAVIPAHTVYHDVTRLTAQDLYLFNEGTHARLYQKLGAHPMTRDGAAGTYFAVWAPAAEYVSVLGDFNGWHPGHHALRPRESSGIWEGFISGVRPCALYKYHIASRYDGYRVEKADLFAVRQELPPRTASVIQDLAYTWEDGEW